MSVLPTPTYTSPRCATPGGRDVELVVRNMSISDLGGVVAVEKACYETWWTSEMFQEELSEERSWRRVALPPGRTIAGFMIGRCYPDLWHVMNLAVAPALRGRGIGGRLLEEFLEAADGESVGVLLEVRPSNQEAISLYGRRGFGLMGVRRGYYTDSHEDALVMTRGSRCDE